MHNATPVLVALLLLLSGCTSAQSMIDPETRSGIPEGATAVKLTTEDPPSEVYKTLYQTLAREGFEIAQENEEMGTLSTGMKEIEQNTTMGVSAFVEERGGETVATLRGKWFVTGQMAAGMSAAFGAGMGGGDAQEAKWEGSGRPALAFGRLAELANDLPYGEVSYATD